MCRERARCWKCVFKGNIQVYMCQTRRWESGRSSSDGRSGVKEDITVFAPEMASGWHCGTFVEGMLRMD